MLRSLAVLALLLVATLAAAEPFSTRAARIGAPVPIVSGATTDAGVSLSFSRADHQHQFFFDAGVSLLEVADAGTISTTPSAGRVDAWCIPTWGGIGTIGGLCSGLSAAASAFVPVFSASGGFQTCGIAGLTGWGQWTTTTATPSFAGSGGSGGANAPNFFHFGSSIIHTEFAFDQVAHRYFAGGTRHGICSGFAMPAPGSPAVSTYSWAGIAREPTINGGRWGCCAGNGSNTSCTDTGVAAAANTTYVVLIDTRDAPTSITCTINGTATAHTTHVPAVGVMGLFLCESVLSGVAGSTCWRHWTARMRVP